MKVKRDGNILKSIQREISLSSRVVKSKKVYSRKNLNIIKREIKELEFF